MNARQLLAVLVVPLTLACHQPHAPDCSWLSESGDPLAINRDVGGTGGAECRPMHADPVEHIGERIYQEIVSAERASRSEPREIPVAALIQWIREHTSKHGLVQEFEPCVSPLWPAGERSYIYPISVVMGGLLESGEIRDAQRIADAMVKRQQRDGSWYTDYSYFTGRRMGNNRAHTGEVAFLSMELFSMYRVTGEAKYLEAARSATAWIAQFQMLDSKSPRYGSVAGGLDQSGERYVWTSTENNAGILSLFYYLGKATGDADLLERATLIADWLVRSTESGGVWHAREKYFHVGLQDLEGTLSSYDEPSDCQALTLLALQATQDLHGHDPREYKDSLKWLLRYRKTVDYRGRRVIGFSVKPFENTCSIDVSIVQYYTHAADAMGESELASYFKKELDKLRDADGFLPWMVATDTSLSWPYHMPHVHPLTVGLDLMRTNFYILDDSLKAQPIADRDSVEQAVRLLAP